MLTQTNQLTLKQLDDLKYLLEKCKKNDGNSLPIYEHILINERVIKGSFLYYEEQQLVGFLSVFFFYEKACEIALMVSPENRQKGLAKTLVQQTLPLLYLENIEDLIFSTVPNQLNTWLSYNGFQYQNSQFEMLRNTATIFEIPTSPLQVRRATADDIQALCMLDMLCFTYQDPHMVSRLYQLIEDEQYSLYVAQLDGRIIGKAHAHRQSNDIRLSDIAIHPQMQGKGFGTRLLMSCINDILTTGNSNIFLDVETKNSHALRLYTNLGFFSINSCDYWTISLTKINQFT